MKFTSAVSRGSRFNQIYIPKSMENKFESGDLVEVRLLQKRIRLFYSESLPKLSPFKEKLIRDIFSLLSRYEGVRRIFVVGSFLTQKVDYNDIDLLLVTDKKDSAYEERIYSNLLDRFDLRFHVISVGEDRLPRLLEICPLTRSMLYHHVSDKKLVIPPRRKTDKNHLRFLLMMPEDVLEISVGSRILYDSLRRLLTVERFLGKKDEDPLKVNAELMEMLGEPLFSQSRGNEAIDEKSAQRMRTLIASKLTSIKKVV